MIDNMFKSQVIAVQLLNLKPMRVAGAVGAPLSFITQNLSGGCLFRRGSGALWTFKKVPVNKY
jgi:hypothetical protein